MGMRESIVCSLLMALITSSTFADNSPPDSRILVRIRVNANYIEHPEVLEQVIASSPLSVNYIVAPGDTLSGVISKKFKIGVSNSEAAYRAFEQSIKESNNLTDSDTLAAGRRLTIPDLPPLAKTNPNRSKTANSIPRISTYSSFIKSIHKDGWTSEPPNELHESLDSDFIATTGNDRIGAQEVFIIRAVEPEQAKTLITNFPNNAEVLNAPVQIQSADASFDSNSPSPLLIENPLKPDEQTIVRQKMALPATQHPVLFVLDDTWPDDAAFVQSRDYLVKAINRVRASYRLADADFSHAFLSSTSAPQSSGGAIGESHAHEIERSISPFTDMDPTSQHVEVIYVPLFLSQTGSKELLEKLIELDQIVLGMHNNGGDPIPSDLKATASAQSDFMLKSLDTDLKPGPNQSDQVVIESLIVLAQLDSQLTHQPFFVNMSWTVPGMQFQPFIPSMPRGLLVSAAGNEGGPDGRTVYDLKRQFAFRSLSPGDTLAVMNIDDTGEPSCGSSLLAFNQMVYGLGFSGSLANTPCGGSSFSSPRVAWLIAARESTLPAPKDENFWATTLKGELTTMRNVRANRFNQIRFDVRQFFSAVPDR